MPLIIRYFKLERRSFIIIPACKPGKRNYRTTHYDISPTLMHSVLGVINPPSDIQWGHLLMTLPHVTGIL